MIERAIATSRTSSISMLVGTSTDVRLGGELELHLRPVVDDLDLEFQRPPLAWFAAESQRWPEAMFVTAARHWLRLAATHGTPLSGGVLAAADLRNAVVEITRTFYTYPEEVPDRSPTSFRGRMEQEKPPQDAKTMIRRVYPITLLGPKFASQVDVDTLRDAGAANVESINSSIIFDSTRSLIEAWSPEFLAATTALRRLLWPLSMQNPADDPDVRPKPRR